MKSKTITFSLLLVSFLVLVLTSACASRGQRGVQLTQTCAALENVKAYCQSAINKPRQLQQVCDNAPLASLLCAVGTIAQPSESAAASISRSNCPPAPSSECVGALVASQSWRMLTNDRKKLLLTCAEYINQTEACK